MFYLKYFSHVIVKIYVNFKSVLNIWQINQQGECKNTISVNLAEAFFSQFAYAPRKKKIQGSVSQGEDATDVESCVEPATPEIHGKPPEMQSGQCCTHERAWINQIPERLNTIKSDHRRHMAAVCTANVQHRRRSWELLLTTDIIVSYFEPA